MSTDGTLWLTQRSAWEQERACSETGKISRRGSNRRANPSCHSEGCKKWCSSADTSLPWRAQASLRQSWDANRSPGPKPPPSRRQEKGAGARGQVKQQIHLIPCVRGSKEPGLTGYQEPLRTGPALLGALLVRRDKVSLSPGITFWSVKALASTANLSAALSRGTAVMAGRNLLCRADGLGKTPKGCCPLLLGTGWCHSKLPPTSPSGGGRS